MRLSIKFLLLSLLTFLSFHSEAKPFNVAVTPDNAEQYPVSLEFKQNKECVMGSVEFPAESGGHGPKWAMFISRNEHTGEDFVFYLHPQPFPGHKKSDRRHVNFCSPRHVLENAVLNIAYGCPASLCLYDRYKIDLNRFWEEWEPN